MGAPLAIHARNLICIGVDKVTGRDYSGRIWHQYRTGPIHFSTSMELIQEMDELYDRWDFPQRSTQVRHFGNEEPKTLVLEREEDTAYMDEARIKDRAGDIGTFIVRVKYRQNATWQGEVVWAEKQERKYFRSALELLKLIDSALEETETEDESPPEDEEDGPGDME